VEDEALVALVMEDLLRAEGFETALACCEQEAKSYSAHDIAVAIVDLCLDGVVCGQRIIKFLRITKPNLPVVVVTGYHSDAPEASLQGLQAPIKRLHKPEHLDELIAAVWGVIGQTRFGSKP